MNSLNIICHITLILCIHYIQTYKNTLDCIYIKHKYFYLHQHCGTLVFLSAPPWKSFLRKFIKIYLKCLLLFCVSSVNNDVNFFGFSATWNNLRLPKNHDITRRKTKVPIINLVPLPDFDINLYIWFKVFSYSQRKTSRIRATVKLTPNWWPTTFWRSKSNLNLRNCIPSYE